MRQLLFITLLLFPFWGQSQTLVVFVANINQPNLNSEGAILGYHFKEGKLMSTSVLIDSLTQTDRYYNNNCTLYKHYVIADNGAVLDLNKGKLVVEIDVEYRLSYVHNDSLFYYRNHKEKGNDSKAVYAYSLTHNTFTHLRDTKQILLPWSLKNTIGLRTSGHGFSWQHNWNRLLALQPRSGGWSQQQDHWFDVSDSLYYHHQLIGAFGFNTVKTTHNMVAVQSNNLTIWNAYTKRWLSIPHQRFAILGWLNN